VDAGEGTVVADCLALGTECTDVVAMHLPWSFMATFLIESAEHEAALELSSYDASFYMANLRSRGVSGTARVGTFMSNGLADFFAYFAENWRGWKGSKRWSSLEGELSLDAHSDSLGHVCLIVSIRDGAPANWTLRADLVLEAGMLPNLAARAKEFEMAVVPAA
jgi:hypothetical protein